MHCKPQNTLACHYYRSLQVSFGSCWRCLSPLSGVPGMCSFLLWTWRQWLSLTLLSVECTWYTQGDWPYSQGHMEGLSLGRGTCYQQQWLTHAGHVLPVCVSERKRGTETESQGDRKHKHRVNQTFIVPREVKTKRGTPVFFASRCRDSDQLFRGCLPPPTHHSWSLLLPWHSLWFDVTVGQACKEESGVWVLQLLLLCCYESQVKT